MRKHAAFSREELYELLDVDMEEAGTGSSSSSSSSKRKATQLAPDLRALWTAARGVSQRVPEVCDYFRASTNFSSNKYL
jgi:hypothetical protein